MGYFALIDLLSAEITSAPLYHVVLEGFLLLGIIWLFLRKRYSPYDRHHLSEKEKEDLITEWQPEPLVPDTDQNHYALHSTFVEGKMGKYVSVDGKQCLNLATTNFLGLIGDQRIEDEAKKAIFKYGVGSCGPRAFYGTVDVHLQFEEDLAEYVNCESTVLYSYGFAAVSSAIPAYAKRGDIIFADRGVNFAIQKGILASRSRVEWFQHNDAEDLERLLKIQAEKDAQNQRKAKITRRFMIVEGLYLTTGDICPLPDLLKLKWRYNVRIFIDESLSFGVLGDHGRGVMEHFNVDTTDVDLMLGSLEHVIGSTGGFAAGRNFVTDHQLLSGLGYCFSASLPPLLAVAGIEALKIMKDEPERFQKLTENSLRLHSGLRKALKGSGFRIRTPSGTPLMHLVWRGETEMEAELAKQTAERNLDELVDRALKANVALTRARYLEHDEVFLPEPSIRLCVSCELTSKEIDDAVEKIKNIAKSIKQ